MQSILNTLNKFCISWKLQVNKQKSKVIIFNSNGKSFLNHFKIENDILETVKSYCYLGVTINYTGNLNLAKAVLMEKGRKAWFKINKIVSVDNPCNLLEKLFDTLVSPIILYSSEVWGAQGKGPSDSDPHEYLHLKFIKEILGVHYKATYVACMTELNRKPLRVLVQIKIINFLVHILDSPGSLVLDILNATKESSPWMKYIKTMLDNLGFSYLKSNLNNIHFYTNRIIQRINYQCKQNTHNSLNESPKLSFFNKVYIKRPAYLDIYKYKTDRSILSKFRVSAHRLAIEKGRYQNIDRNERLCKSCNNGNIEDEFHFFSVCPHYESLRNIYIAKTGIKNDSLIPRLK